VFICCCAFLIVSACISAGVGGGFGGEGTAIAMNKNDKTTVPQIIASAAGCSTRVWITDFSLIFGDPF
jgi:hypothetical protein